jgi:hypothetical protein
MGGMNFWDFQIPIPLVALALAIVIVVIGYRAVRRKR